MSSDDESASVKDGSVDPESHTADVDGGGAVSGKKRKRPVVTELDPEKLKQFEEAERKKGVIYLAKIPPFMKPVKVKQLLSPYGTIGRLYLAPEDPAVYKRRVASGGNKKEMFVEGWVEFLDKRDAKMVARALNNQPVEPNKKHGFYAGDRWNIIYLKKFKWHHLTEKIAYENRIRAQKLRKEIAAARKDAEVYIERAEQSKHIQKKEKKRAAAGDDDAAAVAGAGDARTEFDTIRRHYHQRKALPDRVLESRQRKQKAEVGGGDDE